MPADPELSVVTALYNCLDYTKAYLASLEETLDGVGIHYEVILVDDGSSDGTREFLATLGGPYRVILNAENLGYAGANNRGVQAAKGEVLALLNNDLVLTGRWLEPMLKGLETLPEAGIVGNIQMSTSTGLVDHAGVFFDRNGRPAHARKGRKAIPKGEFREWYAVTAACIVLRKSVFEEIGGFDEGYRNGTEDIDLCVRLRKAGYKHYVANTSIIQHHVSVSPGRVVHDDANMDRFVEKWQATTIEWGKREWAREYLQRYARRWWRYNFTKFWKAIWLLITQPQLPKY